MANRQTRIELLLVVIATGLFAADLCFVAPSIFQSCDFITMWKPIWTFVNESLRSASMPLWNPYIGLGRPFLADPENMVFYPPAYLVCLGLQPGTFLLVWLHSLIAVFGMRRLGEALQAGRAQSYFMALCLLGSGAMTARWMTGQIPYCWALCYTPWLFACAVRTGEPWQIRRVAFHGGILALQFLCGNPPVFWFSTIGQALFIFGHATSPSLRETLLELRRGATQFAAAFFWCLGLVAVVLLPCLELIGQSNRSKPTRALSRFVQLEWHDFANFFSPVGDPAHSVNWEKNLFLGFAAVLLGIAGLTRVRERNVRGLLVLFIGALLIALSSNTPAFELFYRALPGFAGFRCQSRVAFLAVFALICGAGIFLSRPHPRFAAIWKNKSSIAKNLFIALVVIQSLDLLRATHLIKDAYTFEKIFGYAPVFPAEQQLADHLQSAGLLENLQSPPRVNLPRQLSPPNDAMIYRFSTFNADKSLFLRRDWDYLHRMAGLTPSELFNSFIPDDVSTRAALPYSDIALSAGFDTHKNTFYVANAPSPRAFLLSHTEVAGYNEILSRLASGQDIKKSTLLEQPLAVPLSPSNSATAIPVAIHDFHTDSLIADVDSPSPALLVLAEAWYPGWLAEIDGQIIPCVPANIWMRAVPVPAGQHHVKIYYRQNHLALGGLITMISAICLAIVFLSSRKKPVA